VDYRAMANGHVLPYDYRLAGIAVYLAMLLDARAFSDPHLRQVCPDDCKWPDAATLVDDDITDDYCLWCDIA
jgi:hypothetical protein